MKKTLLIVLGAAFALAGSTFASGEVTTGSTLTGTNLTGTVLTGSTLTGTVLTGSTNTGSTASGSTTTGTTATGSNNTGAVSTGMCMNSGAMVRNDALVAISLAYTESLKAATLKLKAAVDAAKASGKTDAEIKVMIATAFDVWKTEMKSARKIMNIAKANAKKAFEATKKGCKEQRKEHKEDHKNDDDKKSSSSKKSEVESHKSSGHSESDDDKGGSRNRGRSGR